ncbi:protein of unknown function [Serratia sp. Tan611]|nr:protein of unknown function [Serratia sp. Tan611]
MVATAKRTGQGRPTVAISWTITPKLNTPKTPAIQKKKVNKTRDKQSVSKKDFELVIRVSTTAIK